MMVGFRDPARKDAAHLAYVRLQPCCCGCGSPAPSEAAHIRYRRDGMDKRSTGMQEKAHDRFTVPLSAWCHREGPDAQHRGNEDAFWTRVGKDPFAIAADLWRASGGEARDAQPRAAPKPRKIKARPQRHKRKKIARGRGIQSNPTIPSRGFWKPQQPTCEEGNRR